MYKGPADSGVIDYNRLKVDGNFISNMNSQNPIKLNGGKFTIKTAIYQRQI